MQTIMLRVLPLAAVINQCRGTNPNIEIFSLIEMKKFTNENIGRLLADIASLTEAHSQSGCSGGLGWAEYKDCPDTVESGLLATCPQCDSMHLISL
jgi:hypothetical protein